MFSAFGTVQKIAIFEKNGQTQALIQYPGINHIQLLVLELVDCAPFLYIFLKCIVLDGSILILLCISFFIVIISLTKCFPSAPMLNEVYVSC